MAAAVAVSDARDSMPSWWQKAARASTNGAPPVLPRPASAMAAVSSDEIGQRGTNRSTDVKSRNTAKKAGGRVTMSSTRTRPTSAGFSAMAVARRAVAAAHLANRQTAVATIDLAESEERAALTDVVVANAIPPAGDEQEPALTWAAPRTPREWRSPLPIEDAADLGSKASNARRFKKGTWPVSVVCPAEVRDLRAVSISRGHGGVAAEHSASVRADARERRAKASFDYVDLQGGNGRWRQRKAEVDFEQRRAEQEVRQREESVRREKKAIKLAAVEARRRQHLQDLEARCREEHQRRLREEAEEQQRRLREEEDERLRREAEERERRARQPRDCETCGGSGLCGACNGEGAILTLFLSAHVNSQSTMNYGRVFQGCEKCGGASKGGAGDQLQAGSGKCVTCQGAGKLAPKQVSVFMRSSMSWKQLAEALR